MRSGAELERSYGSKGSREPWKLTTTGATYGVGESYFFATAAVDPLNGYLAGLSWPPRSYTCSFCEREFRSAQALGGHMNVHRKDRARLRQSSPPPWESTTKAFPSSVDHDRRPCCIMPDLNLSPNQNYQQYYFCCMPDLNISPPLPCCCSDHNTTEINTVFDVFPSSSSTASIETAVVPRLVLPKTDDVALNAPLAKANLDLELRLGFI